MTEEEFSYLLHDGEIILLELSEELEDISDKFISPTQSMDVIDYQKRCLAVALLHRDLRNT